MTGPAAAQGPAVRPAGSRASREAVEAALARIEATNRDWHIFISVDAEGARQAADESDARRQAGTLLGPLDGVPVAVKDNLDVEGAVTTNGSNHALAPAGRDAEAVARLRKAGAVVLGKLNMHEGALGATTDNPFWGRCENPRVPGHTPGGSSGGSGAAVAGSIVPIALGTDTMGSVRIPAAYCGVWGLKPTRGFVPRRGLSYLSWTLDSIGPLADNADDLALAFAAIAGRGADDPDGLDAPESADHAGSDPYPSDLVIGVLPEIVGQVGCEPAVLDAHAAMVESARRAGATIRVLTLEDWRPTEARRAGLLVSEAEAGALLGKQIDEGAFSPSFRDMIDFGRRARGERVAEAYRRLHLLRFAALDALRQVDAILLPSAPQRAFAHGTPAPVNQADFTALANIAGCPAVAFPRPAPDGGAPCSAQFVGRPWSDLRLVGMARALSHG